MTNGEKLLATFPKATARFFTDLCGIGTVDVDFNDPKLSSWGEYSVHTFTREWWDADVNIEKETPLKTFREQIRDQIQIAINNHEETFEVNVNCEYSTLQAAAAVVASDLSAHIVEEHIDKVFPLVKAEFPRANRNYFPVVICDGAKYSRKPNEFKFITSRTEKPHVYMSIDYSVLDNLDELLLEYARRIGKSRLSKEGNFN